MSWSRPSLAPVLIVCSLELGKAQERGELVAQSLQCTDAFSLAATSHIVIVYR